MHYQLDLCDGDGDSIKALLAEIQEKGGYNLLVMVMMMCLSSFPSPTRCSSSGAALVVTFTILLFQFPSSTTSRCGTSNLVTSCLHWRVLQAIEIFTT